jgi:hypothetical protein
MIKSLISPKEISIKPGNVIVIKHIIETQELGFRFILGFELAPNRSLQKEFPIEIK